MAVAARRARLGELLIESGRVTREQVDVALQSQQRWRGRLGEYLVQSHAVTEQDLAMALAHQTKTLFVSDDRLLSLEVPPAVVKLLNRDRAERLQVLPIALRDRALYVASPELETPERAAGVRFATGYSSVKFVLATPSAFRRALTWAYAGL